MTESPDSSGHSNSYSYSYTPSGDEEEELPLMWRQITRIPIDALWKNTDFSYMNKVLDLASRYEFNEHDVHLTDAKLTVLVGSILKLVATKCSEKIREEQAHRSSAEDECGLLKEKIILQNKEATRLRAQLEAALRAGTSNDVAAIHTVQADARAADAKAENDELQLKLRRLGREVEVLKQKVLSSEDSARQANEYYTKMQREYSHLVAQLAKEKERHTDLDRLHRRLSEADAQRRHADDARKKLELELGVLRHDKKRLEESLHKAEDSLQVLKRDTLNDMDRAQSLMRKKDEFWEQKMAQCQERLVGLESQKEESMRTIADLEHELEDCKAEVERLQQLVQASSGDRRFANSDSDSRTASSDGSQEDDLSDNIEKALPPQERRVIDRLERENDNLLDALRKLEAQNASMEDEKNNLRQILNQYEQQDNGLGEMRRQLEHLRGVKGNLEQEVTQLKQRLNSATDTLAYTKALEELCRGLGVTKDELHSLRPQNSVAYNEVDTLREEVNVLKEEVEWLEKDRRHWMDKVRLQPLMDTKLRLQLGLTSEQLRQIDDLVEQMRLGADVVEDTEDGNFREKYFRVLEARRRDAEQFNEFVKKRIDEAIAQAFQGVCAPETASAVSALKDHIDVITSSGRASAAGTASGALSALGDTHVPSDTRQLQSQVYSLTRRVEQSDLALKDNESAMSSLREQLAVVTAERDLLGKERDQYRDAIFDAAGVANGGSGPGDGDSDDVGADASPAVAPLVADRDSSNSGTAAPVGDSLPTLRMSANKWATISTTLREQLRSKDTLIASFADRMKEAQRDEDVHKEAMRELEDALAAARREKELLVDQVASLNATCEDSQSQIRALQKLNKELRDAAHVDDRELLQKVVLLRRREAHLLQRVRRAQAAALDCTDEEKTLNTSIKATLQALKDHLAGSPGYVLPPSATQHSAEQEMLSHLHDSVANLLTGKLFREDTRFIAQLQRIYHAMETSQEMVEARAACRLKERELEDLQRRIDTAALPAASETAPQTGIASPRSPESSAKGDSRSWESDATTWRQKYTLCAKRLEDKEREVELLEKDLDDARAEVLEARDQLRADRGGTPTQSGAHDGAKSATSVAPSPDALPPPVGASHSMKVAAHSARLERDVAQLKSVNLSLIQLSLDLQGRIKSLELDVEGRDQEISLIKDSGNSVTVSSFVSAAIREHAALRRQTELALIHVKRLKVQLAASEANYHVVANEATSYKLNAYRLYRRYVEETTATVDYLRAHQRTTGGALSARRVEAMATRFRALAADLSASFRRNQSLATQLSDEASAVVTLEQQISLLKADSKREREDLSDTRLREARIAVRDAARQLTESKEDCKHAELRAARLDEYVKQLDAELSRMEFDAPKIAALSDNLVEKLQDLKDSILQPPEAHQRFSLTAYPASHGSETARGDTSEPDVAVREYKAAVMRQMELAAESERLTTELSQRSAECRKHAATISELRDEISRLEDCASGHQMQMEAERKKAEVRESRLLAAHENQVNVVRRATEHNVMCLKDLLQKKEAVIKSLEEQLQAERRKYVEHQYEEAARMEKLHENMFRENSAMVDRFREAVEGVSDTLSFEGLSSAASVAAGGLPEQTVVAQLQALTAETVRLRSELRRVRTTNTVLEAQLAHRIGEAQLESGRGAVPTVDQLVAPQLSSAAGAVNWPAAATADGGARSPTSFSPPSSSSADTLSSIVQYQNAMIASLREREVSLSEEVQRESAQRAQLAQQLHAPQERHIEQGGTLDFVAKASVGDSPLVHELRSQLAQVEQELRTTKEQLAFERQTGKRLQVDADEWKAHLATLQTEVAAQQVEAERSKQLAMLNQNLRDDLNAVKEQNDKLVLAASALKQKLLDEVAQGGESQRQRQQEVALAQRMGAIQQESSAHLHLLERRVRAVQKELDTRLEKEKDMIRTNEESQRLAYKLHHDLRAKDREIAQLQAALATARAGAATGAPREVSRSVANASSEAGTQVLPTSTPVTDDRGGGSTSTPGSAHWDQKENLQHISTLRSQTTRLEKDWRACRDQLAAERETTRSLRLQIQSMKKQREELEAAHARECARLHQQHSSPSAAGTTSVPVNGTDRIPSGVGAMPEGGVPQQATATQTLIRELESQNDALRRQLSVDTPARINDLEHRLSRQGEALRRVAAELAAMQGTTLRDVLQRYETAVGVAKTVEDMESQLLQKNNELLDLRFAKESLELRVSRLEHQIGDATRSGGGEDGAPTGRPGQWSSTATTTTTTVTEKRNLETVIENMRIVIERLQSENRTLVAHSTHTDLRYKQLLREVVELREVATALAAGNARLERSAFGARNRTSGGASSETDDLLRRLTAAQSATRQCESELRRMEETQRDTAATTQRAGAFTHVAQTRLEDGEQFGSVPPPLPAAPFSREASSSSGLPIPVRRGPSTSSSQPPSQRRLSASNTSLASRRHSTLPHHRGHTQHHQ